MDKGADRYTKRHRARIRVRHGCETVRPFIGANGDRLTGASMIEWSPLLTLVVGHGLFFTIGKKYIKIKHFYKQEKTEKDK